MSQAKTIVKMKGITKKFLCVTALSDVDFELKPGEIHGLMGENGAGKSTLIKVLTGVFQPEKGEIFFEGNKINPANTLEAQKIGISTVYQEVNLCPNLSVAENIFIGREPKKKGRIDWDTINKKSEKLLDVFDLDIDVNKPLSYYPVAIQQMTAIVRALDISAKVLILDEPTASLDKDETKKLFSVMRKLKEDGMGIIFITHFIDNVYEITDRISVLRNGKLIDNRPTSSFPKIELVEKMIGKELKQLDEKHQIREIEKDEEPFFQGRQLKNNKLAEFNLNLYKGEVMGLAGLLGSGRSEMAKLIFGIEPADEGEMYIDGKKIKNTSPKEAMNNGISFCPEDRKAAGLIGDLTVRENLILALQVKNGYFRYLSKEKQEKIADKYIELLDIVTPNAEQQIKNLSGGNQQKVILARWLITEPDLLILDEPTRGIDVGTKAEIQKLVISLANEGMSIIFISSELDEVIRVSHRVTVLRDRHKITELTGDKINETTIMETIASGRAL